MTEQKPGKQESWQVWSNLPWAEQRQLEREEPGKAAKLREQEARAFVERQREEK